MINGCQLKESCSAHQNYNTGVLESNQIHIKHDNNNNKQAAWSVRAAHSKERQINTRRRGGSKLTEGNDLLKRKWIQEYNKDN